MDLPSSLNAYAFVLAGLTLLPFALLLVDFRRRKTIHKPFIYFGVFAFTFAALLPYLLGCFGLWLALIAPFGVMCYALALWIWARKP